jgi:hypothetical protein
VTFIGVGTQDTESSMQSFIDASGVGLFPNIYDADFAVWAEFEVRSQPTFVFVAADGTRTRFGSMNESDIADQIAQLF